MEVTFILMIIFAVITGIYFIYSLMLGISGSFMLHCIKECNHDNSKLSRKLKLYLKGDDELLKIVDEVVDIANEEKVVESLRNETIIYYIKSVVSILLMITCIVCATVI